MGRIEALPTPTYFSNAPAIVDWRREYGHHITRIEQARAPLKIRGKGQVATCETANLEHRYKTRTDDRWHVEVIPDTSFMGTGLPQLSRQEINDAAEYLTVHQQLYVPKGAEKAHAEAINFLARNWEQVRKTLYPIKPSGDVPPYHFSEVLVDTKTMERADFIGFGPDGRLFVFEFKRKWNRYTQADKFAKKLENTFSNFNIPITPYMAWYDDSKQKRIHIQVPQQVKISAGNQMDYYIKLREEQKSKNQSQTSTYREFDQFVINFKQRLQRAG